MNEQDVNLVVNIIKVALLQNFTEEEVKVVMDTVIIERYKNNTILFVEGELSNNMYIILEGSINVKKHYKIHGEYFELAMLSQGHLIGELSFLDNSPRTATACCIGDVKLAILSKEKLQQYGEFGNNILNKIRLNIVSYVTENLRNLNTHYISVLKVRLDDFKNRLEFGELFMSVIASFCIASIVNKIINDHFAETNLYSPLFSWIYFITLVIPTLCFSLYTKHSLHSIGVTLKESKEAIWTAVLYTIPMYIFLIVIHFINTQYFSSYSIGTFKSPDSYLNLIWMFFLYFLHSYLQELVARGILQTSLIKFYGKNKKNLAIIIASLCFSVFHIYLGISAVFITFISSLYFGWIHTKNNNLLCVTIVHSILGFQAYALGFI